MYSEVIVYTISTDTCYLTFLTDPGSTGTPVPVLLNFPTHTHCYRGNKIAQYPRSARMVAVAGSDRYIIKKTRIEPATRNNAAVTNDHSKYRFAAKFTYGTQRDSHVSREEILLVYDGECPACSAYCQVNGAENGGSALLRIGCDKCTGTDRQPFRLFEQT